MPTLNKLRINGVDYDIVGGGGGTSNYNDLTNKPQINGNELSGNKTSAQLGLASSSDIPDVSTKYDSNDSASTDIADNDYVPFYDTSATAKKKTLWSNIKEKLKTYFDGIYASISSIGNGTLTIQKNGTTLKTFSANQSINDIVDITVPTKTSDLTNDSDFITGLAVLTYDVSTWQEFLEAFNANKLVLCKVPTTSTRARYAFLSFYNGDEHSAEFQYYRSISTHTDIDQGDEVYVYKLTSYSTWTTTTRKTYSTVGVISGRGLTKTYQNSGVYLAIDYALTTKLEGIESGAQVNVQSDWNVTDTSSDAFIKNKPTIPNVSTKYDSSDTTEATLADDDKVPFYDTSATSRRNSTWANIKAKLKSYFDTIYASISSLATVATSGSYNDLSNKPTIPAAQIQSDWNQNNATQKDYIKNKPYVYNFLVNKQSMGLCPQLPDETTTNKFLRQDGSWSVPASTPSATAWGTITGTLTDQDDLKDALANKLDKENGIGEGPIQIGGTDPMAYEPYVEISPGIIKIYRPIDGKYTEIGPTYIQRNNYYIGGNVLWTNPSPTADFAAQTVALSGAIQGFKYYSVIYKNTSSGERYNSTGMIPVGFNAQMRVSTDYNFTRNITFSSTSTSADFTACSKYTTYGSSTTSKQNTYCIPYQIIGWIF